MYRYSMSRFEQDLWSDAPVQPVLAAQEVHVWRASLDVATASVEEYRRVLVEDELVRADRFHFAHDRQRWTVAHGVLRLLLARYLAVATSVPRFVTNKYGKPAVVVSGSEMELCFNLSHSGSLALYAFALHRDVGVDVEYMRANVGYLELARHVFSAHERAVLEALPADLQEEAFFQCWSRKEAYIKARGRGLSLPLRDFDVSLDPREAAALLASREEPDAPERWLLQALYPGTRYAGALVAQGHDWRVRCLQWPAAL